MGCIALAKFPMFRARTKHIDIKFHLFREKVKKETFQLKYMPTDVMIADGLAQLLDGLSA